MLLMFILMRLHASCDTNTFIYVVHLLAIMLFGETKILIPLVLDFEDDSSII